MSSEEWKEMSDIVVSWLEAHENLDLSFASWLDSDGKLLIRYKVYQNQK